MTFGMWWIYFVVPSGHVLHAHRERSFGWGYGHIPLFGATVAVGAGLHAAAYYIEHHTVLGAVGTVLTVAVPLALYVAGGLPALCADHAHLRPVPPAPDARLGRCAGGGWSLMAAAGVPVVWCLLVLAATPWVTVVGYETVGHRHNERVIASLPGGRHDVV